MFEFVTPHALFRNQIRTLRETFPGVLDGVGTSIHDARIATRRVRELLPLLADPKRRKPIEELSSRFKHARLEVREQREADIRIADAAERSAEADQPESTGHVSLLKQVIDAECNEFHARYLARRSAILAICAEARRQRQTRTRSLVVAGAVALSSSIYARLR